MSLLKERQERSFPFGGNPLATYLFGVLTGAALVVLAGAAIGLGTDPLSVASAAVGRMFIIKVALSASALIVTIFAVVMTIRSQIRQRIITAKIDQLYERTEFLSNQ